jgi:hypothetical protein
MIGKTLQDYIDDVKSKYKRAAHDIVGDFNQETGIKKDYQGRQIFELLQNADDAAPDGDGTFVNVKIELIGNRFKIQNSGIPFSVDGIASLMYPNTSTKSLQRGKIGHKGLGFRAVLNWTESIKITTDEFAVEFNREYAMAKVKAIVDEDKRLKEQVYELCGEYYPAAVLSFPKQLDKGSAVLDKGYATAIFLECTSDVAELVKNELRSLTFEEMIFLKHIRKIIIKINDEKQRIISLKKNNDIVLIKDSLRKLQTEWRIFEENGDIGDDNKKYEFIIAYSSEKTVQKKLREKGVLYSYFRTEIKMPFPFLTHATFELTSNRNGLTKDTVNKRLIEKLIRFIGRTATKIASDEKRCDYNPLAMLIPDSSVSYVLETSFSFSQKLKESIDDLRVFPTVTGKYISLADNPKYSDIDFDKSVISERFPELLKHCDDEVIKDYIKSKASFYSELEMTDRLNADADTYSTDEKIQLIILFVKQYPKANVVPKLLLDSSSKRIVDDHKVFNNPDINDVPDFDLPEWASIRFIYKRMEEELKKRFAKSLSFFKVDEYSFDRVICHLVSQAGNEKSKVISVVRWLFNYWQKHDRVLPPDIKKKEIKVVSRLGEVVSAKECFFGYEYNNKIGENILKILDVQFLSDRKTFQITEESEDDCTVFFEAIGVGKFPIIKENVSLNPIEQKYYTEYNAEKHSKLRIKESSEFYKHRDLDIKKIVVRTIVGIEKILKTATTNDVLAWLLTDSDIRKCLSNENEISSYMKVIPAGKRKEGTVPYLYMRSYLCMIFKQTPWLETRSGKNTTIDGCTIFDDKLSPLIEVIKINYTGLETQLGRPVKKDIVLLLKKMGLADDFTGLPKERIYGILLGLPEVDKNYEIGRTVYYKLNEAYSGKSVDDLVTGNKAYERFKKCGKVLVEYNKKPLYVPVQEAFYADNKLLSRNILNEFKILVLGSRAGEDKVQKLLCVQPQINIDKIEVQFDEHALQKEFSDDYKKCLPFIYSNRINDDTKDVNLHSLKKTQIILCSAVKFSCKIDNEPVQSELENYETSYQEKENRAYIKVPQEVRVYSDIKQNKLFSGAVSEIITAILGGIFKSKNFFRELIECQDEQSREYMCRDYGDEYLMRLNDSKKKFSESIDNKTEFWSAVCDACGAEFTGNISEILSRLEIDDNTFNDRTFDYGSISSAKNGKQIITLFAKLNIDIADYNKTAFNKICLTDYYVNFFKKLKMDYRDKYLSSIYLTAKDKVDGRIYFESKKNTYDLKEISSFENSIFTDIKAISEKTLDFSIAILDKQSLVDYSNWQDTLLIPESPPVTNGFVDILHEQRKHQSNRMKFDPRSKFESIMRGEETPYDEPSISNPVDEKRGSLLDEALGRYSGGRHINAMDIEKAQQENGFIGECEVYKCLKTNYVDTGKGSVMWVSENAVLAGVSRSGDDSRGYDIEYFDGKTKHYVEVKASSSDGIEFTLTSNEFSFAHTHRKQYEVWFVSIKDKKVQGISKLGCIFDLSENEDLFDNQRFSIERKDFYIRARKV